MTFVIYLEIGDIEIVLQDERLIFVVEILIFEACERDAAVAVCEVVFDDEFGFVGIMFEHGEEVAHDERACALDDFFGLGFCGAVGADVVSQNDDIFLFIRPKTTEIKNGDLLHTMEYSPNMLTRKSFLNPIDKIDKKIKSFFSCNRVFYLNNEIGEIVHNYLLASMKN